MTAFDVTVDRLGAALDGAEQIVRDGLVASYHEGLADGERLATERIVAWLRQQPGVFLATEQIASMTPYKAADCIERGDHRKGAE